MRQANRLNTLIAFVASLVTQPSAAMTIVHTEKSLYRNIVVYEEDDQRCMSFTRRNQTARQTCRSLDDPNQFVFSYTKMMMGALYLNPNPRKILIVGLGGGVLPTALAEMFPDAGIDIVEIDPAVVRVARQFFDFNPSQRVRVFEEDGRVFVKRAGKAAVAATLEKVYNYFPRLKTRRTSQAAYTSGGEQQMCAIGRALMANPKMVLLDEPSMGLAPQIVEAVFEIVKDLNTKERVTFLLAEQNTNMALRYADYGYILENGRIVMDGEAKALRENEDVKEFYLGMGGGDRKSFRDVKSYKRRKRWLS